jgi:hypothetical protein
VAQLPAEFVTLLIPVRGGVAEIGKLERLRQSSAAGQESAATEYRYQTAGHEHHLFFSQPHQSWSVGPWKTDAEFLYWGVSAHTQMMICCNATHVEFGARTVLSSPRSVLRCEIISGGDKPELTCSDPDGIVTSEPLQATGDEAVLTDSSAEPQGTAS